jgi:hypothetical protein
MVVYILYFSCKTMTEILGVYSTEEKAQEIFNKLYPEFCKSIDASLFVVIREVE